MKRFTSLQLNAICESFTPKTVMKLLNKDKINPLHPCKNQKGFTLIELVIVIVLLGIIGSFGADFISQAFIGFSKTNSRMEIFEEGKLALMRMEYEIRNAVPNAFALEKSDDLRFGMLNENVYKKYSLVGTYKEQGTDFPVKTLTDTSELAKPQTDWVISVFNQNWQDFKSGSRLFSIASVNGPSFTVNKPIGSSSPRNRYYVVDKAIRYTLDGSTLLRSAVAASADGIPDSFPIQGFPVAKNVTRLEFDYIPNPLTRNSIIVINFAITKNEETLDFHKEVHVRNVP